MREDPNGVKGGGWWGGGRGRHDEKVAPYTHLKFVSPARMDSSI